MCGDGPPVRAPVRDRHPRGDRSRMPSRSLAMSPARRRLRSTEPMRSFRSTSSVLSSMTSRQRRAGCHARISITPLTIDREGHLGLHLPTGQEPEHPGRGVMHCRVPRVDEATEIAAPPAYDQVKTSVQSSSDRAHFPQRDRGESAVFDPPNDEPRHVRDRCDILLGLPLPNANRSKCDADLLVVHRPDNGRGRLSAHHQPSLAAKPSRCRFLP